MIRFKLLSAAILGSILGYIIINSYITSMSVIQYLGIELIVTFFHGLYNYIKVSLKPTLN
jgi:hypothetical protein